jgi:hypothetical protein
LLSRLAGAQDPQEIVRRAIEADSANQQTALAYTFLQRQEERQFDGDGKEKQREVRTWDVTLLEGSGYRRLVARDDKPLPPEEQQKEEEKLRQSVEDRRKETAEQREHRLAEWRRRQDRFHGPLKELPNAFNLRLAGQQSVNGTPAWMIDATPKPGYKPTHASAAYFPKIKGRLWIAQADYHWIKVEAETLDTISFGAILFRLAKGAHLVLEQTRIDDEVWVPKHVNVNFNARFVLLKGLRESLDITFTEYKKFQGESHLAALQEKQCERVGSN